PFQPLSGPSGSQTAYQATWGVQKFKLSDGNPEITYTGANPGFSGPGPATYQGTVTLTHNVQINLTGRIGAYLKDHPLDPQEDPPATREMKQMLAAISQLPFKMMAQSMDGLHRQLLMRVPTLQMKVFDPPVVGVDPDLTRKDG